MRMYAIAAPLSMEKIGFTMYVCMYVCMYFMERSVIVSMIGMVSDDTTQCPQSHSNRLDKQHKTFSLRHSTHISFRLAITHLLMEK